MASKVFAAQRIARENAQAHLRRVQSSLPLLERELEDAQNDVKRLELEREHAAEKVFCAEAETLAGDYIAKLNDLRRVSYILNMMHHKQVRRASNDVGTPGVVAVLYGSGPFRKVKTSALSMTPRGKTSSDVSSSDTVSMITPSIRRRPLLILGAFG